MSRGSREQRSPRTTTRGRGVSPVIGFILIVAITVAAVTPIVLFGGEAVANIQSDAEVNNGVNTMSLIDSRTSGVALGGADSARVDTPRGGDGEYTIDGDAGRMTVIHRNYSQNGNEEVLYNRSMGAIVYERDGTSIAYQGGGVWRSEGDAGSSMVSPPEFEYTTETVTLPLIRVTGDTRFNTGQSLTVTDQGRERVYYNRSATYGGTSKSYTNPIRNGTIVVKVQSDYYSGWAQYFRGRTQGTVDVYDGNRTVVVELLTKSQLGELEELPDPSSGESVELQGLGDAHALNDFELNFTNTGSPPFQSQHYSWYAQNGNEYLEIMWDGGSSGYMDVRIYYDADTTDNQYQLWRKEDAFEIKDCGSSCEYFVADMLSSQDMKYVDDTGGPWTNSPPASGSLRTPLGQNQHPDTAIEPEVFVAGDTAPMNHTTQHYMALMGPNVELQSDDKCGGNNGNCGSVNEEASDGSISYDATGGDFITYLLVSERKVHADDG